MRVSTVSTADSSLLDAVRSTIADADDVLMCVAFAGTPGVQLILKELATAKRARLLSTTVFGSTTLNALSLASKHGVEVRVRNPSVGTYHPKLYLSQTGDRAAAVIGSANLTHGLIVNAEVAALLRGKRSHRALRDAHEWAEAQWDAGEDFHRKYDEPPDPIDDELLKLIRAAWKKDPVFLTLGNASPNRVRELSPSALYVETKRSKQRKTTPQPIPAWMLNLAWSVLKNEGKLTNQRLLNELRVHRSSAVLAILARLPGVEPLPSRTVGVRLT